MLQNVRVLSARRAYEFAVDELRVTMLSLPAVIASVQRIFQFQAVQVATPPETFGSVAITFPPGLVFAQGQFITEDQQAIPIRTLSVEPRRLVFDVAAPSKTLDVITAAFLTFAESIHSPDGSAVVGQPQRMLEHSELSFDWPVQLENAFSPLLWKTIQSHVVARSGIEHAQLAPTISFYLQSPGAGFPGATATGHGLLQLTYRADTTLEDGHYFSRAPLPTDEHIAYLEEVERSLQ